MHHAGVQKKLGLKAVGGFAVSQNAGAIHLAAYVPEGKGAPGFVGVWPLDQLSKAESPPPVARRSFFRVYEPATFSVPPFHALLKLEAWKWRFVDSFHFACFPLVYEVSDMLRRGLAL